MLHRHQFTADTRRAALPRIADARPLTGSHYLTLRRRAAGLSEYDLAQRLASLHVATGTRRTGEHKLDIARSMLVEVRLLESPDATDPDPATLDAIAAVLPFDLAVYWQLVRDAPARHPRVCRGCGASHHDHEPVRWSTRSSCTGCDPAGTGL